MTAQLGRLKQQVAYWTACHAVLTEFGSPMSRRVDSTKLAYDYQDFGVGTSGFTLKVAFSVPKNEIHVGLYIHRGSDANRKAIFGLFEREKVTIEEELKFDSRLEWERSRKVPRILTRRDDADPKDKSDWCQQHKWITEHLDKMHGVLATRVEDYVAVLTCPQERVHPLS